MAYLVTSGIRSVRAFFSGGQDETVGFVRFHDEQEAVDSSELNVVANGSLFSKDPNAHDAYGWTDGEVPMGTEHPTEVPKDPEKETRKNQITEWQAGWNVTNAIQVGFIDYFFLPSCNQLLT